ncbi:hypothetical protein Back11_04930 [Paenibacillus baekrokdamisoli]|uniref:Uncharacterized protein n=1 Tax=Paenibacillus baekrokdamisoli TaxID=1712516 RepID=A0A3G9J5Y0_9BACL|nr:response regulator [Paenibacillus baekrokdamisoli]MBB3067666.1 YesN/AraC family two-component response regulator [Paenibacillus baekrokdamisoli]BBH19148.1 hypothetical protein Back11_04930 [Paenibacillus baekrokdamisoli]
MKIIIVDDMPKIREAIATIPEWESMDCQISGEAADGEEALQLIHADPPDILITDIRMPIMDGLQLAKLVRESYPEIYIIFLTAYSDFEYAKQAIKLGVSDFITKPIHVPELIERVRLIKVGKLDSQEEQQKWQDEAFQLLVNPLKSEEEKCNFLQSIQMAERKFIVLSIDIDNIDLLHQSGITFSKLSLHGKANNLMKTYPYVHWSFLSPSGIYLLIFSGDEETTAFRDHVFLIAREILQMCADSILFSTSIELSSLLASLVQLPQGIQEIKQCQDYRMLLGKNSIISFDVLQQLDDPISHRKELNEQALEEVLRVGGAEELHAFIRIIYKEIMGTGLNKNQVQQKILNLLEITDRTRKEFSLEINNELYLQIRKQIFAIDILSDMMVVLENYLKETMAAITHSKQNMVSEEIKAITNYIRLNYMDEITLQTLKDQLFLNYSYTYLSRKIKQETGKHFSDLLTEYRIQEAKRLLLTQSMKSYEIAYKVGFKDPAYFSQLFKKTVGISPKDYK